MDVTEPEKTEKTFAFTNGTAIPTVLKFRTIVATSFGMVGICCSQRTFETLQTYSRAVDALAPPTSAHGTSG